MYFLRRWDNVGPPTPAVGPSPKRFVFSQPISELRGEAAQGSPPAAPPPTGRGPWQRSGAPGRRPAVPPQPAPAPAPVRLHLQPPGPDVSRRRSIEPGLSGLAAGALDGSGGLGKVEAASAESAWLFALRPSNSVRSCRKRASKSSEGCASQPARRWAERPDEGDEVAGLLAGQLVPERRHPGPLAVEHAHDQLGVGPLLLPGAGREVRNGRQVSLISAPGRHPVARGAGSLEGPAPLAEAQDPPGWVVMVRRDVSRAPSGGSGLGGPSGFAPVLPPPLPRPVFRPGRPARTRPPAPRRPSRACLLIAGIDFPLPSRIERLNSASLRVACHAASVKSGTVGITSRTISPLPSVS